MLGAIYIGLSGMNAYSKGLQAISNNVGNLNSAGFKATSVSFTDVFNYGGGGLTYSSDTLPEQSGSGVMFGRSQIDFKQGDLRQSDNDLDLAIQGTGFLVLLNDGKTYYTRTGQFTVNEDGYIAQQGTDYKLAVLNEANQPVAINIDAKRTKAPKATTKVTFADNLSSTATEATVANIAVYDSNGGKQVWQVKLVPTGSAAPGEWKVIVTNQAGTVMNPTTNDPTISGKVRFIGGVVDPTANTLTITDAPSGANALSVVLDFSTGVTNYSSGTANTLRAAKVDGNGVGALTAVTIDDDGHVKLTYSNSETETLGAVALADFRNPQQLERVGNGLFENRSNGQYRLLGSAVDGVGKLVSKQIEASNVDLSQEFGDLILIQRGFQASSQVVSVANDMIQQLFGIRGQG